MWAARWWRSRHGLCWMNLLLTLMDCNVYKLQCGPYLPTISPQFVAPWCSQTTRSEGRRWPARQAPKSSQANMDGLDLSSLLTDTETCRKLRRGVCKTMHDVLRVRSGRTLYSKVLYRICFRKMSGHVSRSGTRSQWSECVDSDGTDKHATFSALFGHIHIEVLSTLNQSEHHLTISIILTGGLLSLYLWLLHQIFTFHFITKQRAEIDIPKRYNIHRNSCTVSSTVQTCWSFTSVRA